MDKQRQKRRGFFKILGAASAVAAVSTFKGTYAASRVAEVWFVGLECRVRQEKSDEIFGVVGRMEPGNPAATTFEFGTWDMGRRGQRIVQQQTRIYAGSPNDLVVSCMLTEHDSGDEAKIKQGIKKTMDAAASAAATALAGTPNIPQADKLQVLIDCSSGFLTNFVDDALGMGDDPYNEGKLIFRRSELEGRPPVKYTLRRKDDPRTIEYTHVVFVSGTDNGGDTGHYAFYFDVRLSDV